MNKNMPTKKIDDPVLLQEVNRLFFLCIPSTKWRSAKGRYFQGFCWAGRRILAGLGGRPVTQGQTFDIIWPDLRKSWIGILSDGGFQSKMVEYCESKSKKKGMSGGNGPTWVSCSFSWATRSLGSYKKCVQSLLRIKSLPSMEPKDQKVETGTTR
jgi:hypothetical protein